MILASIFACIQYFICLKAQSGQCIPINNFQEYNLASTLLADNEMQLQNCLEAQEVLHLLVLCFCLLALRKTHAQQVVFTRRSRSNLHSLSAAPRAGLLDQPIYWGESEQAPYWRDCSAHVYFSSVESDIEGLLTTREEHWRGRSTRCRLRQICFQLHCELWT